MSQNSHKIADFLRQHGYSVTQPRLLVFELLDGQEPMTMADLAERAAGRLDRASLYRIIDLYESLGIVHRLNVGWKYKLELSDQFSEHHHHLTCQSCGRVLPINEAELEQFITALGRRHNFEVRQHQVELQGLCLQCRDYT